METFRPSVGFGSRCGFRTLGFPACSKPLGSALKLEVKACEGEVACHYSCTDTQAVASNEAAMRRFGGTSGVGHVSSHGLALMPESFSALAMLLLAICLKGVWRAVASASGAERTYKFSHLNASDQLVATSECYSCR